MSRLVFDNGLIRVFHGDCREAMATMETGQYSLAIVDPEYGIGESMRTQSRPLTAKQADGTRRYVRGARKHTPKNWDTQRPDASYFKQLLEVSKSQIIWGGNYFADLLPPSAGWVVWDKVNDRSDQSDFEMAWTSFDRAARQFRYMWNGFNQGRGLSEWWKSQGNKKLNEVRIHPTQKPVILYKWLLSNYAKLGDTILDTHGGSLSLAIACQEMGFSLDVWEIDEEYVANGIKRLEHHQSQTTLF